MKQTIYKSLLVLCFFGAISTIKAEDASANKGIENNVRANEWYEPQIIQTFKADGTAIDKSTFIYDLQGNVTTEIKENFLNGAWAYGFRRSYTYDEEGRRLTLLMEIQMSGSLVNGSLNTYTYDADGNMLTDVAQRWVSEAWVNNQRTIWTYNEDGNILVKQQAMWQDGNWLNTSGLTLTYDEDGNKLTETTDFKGTGQERKSWTYDNANNKLTETKEIWKDNAWLNNALMTWTYNEANKQLTYLNQSWATDAWLNSQLQTYSYDEHGYRNTQVNENWQKVSNTWAKSSKYTWTNDANGNILTYLYQMASEGDTWRDFERYECTYSATGDMLTKFQESYATGTSTWAPNVRYTWTYDANRNILSSLMELYRNDIWSVSHQLNYTYDEHGNSILLDQVGSGGSILLYYNNMQSKCTVMISTAAKTTASYINVNAEVVIPVTAVTLNKEEIELEVGQEFQLEAVISPEDATNKSLSWATSNGLIAKVDADTGLVTAVKGGNAVITVTTLDGGFKATCDVKVKIVHVEAVTLNSATLELGVGKTFRLVATILPEDATDKSITWKTSDNSIAMVGSTGAVVAVKNGEAVITVTTTDGGVTATCNVKVVVPVKDVNLNETELDLLVGDTFKLVASVNPVDATNKKVAWSSSNNSIATVSNDGSVKAIAAGEAVITATSVEGNHTATCDVKVGTVSVDDLNTDNIDIIYANDNIIITSNTDVAKVVVYDMGGKATYEANGKVEINTSSWLNGTYIVKAICTNGTFKTKKIIVY